MINDKTFGEKFRETYLAGINDTIDMRRREVDEIRKSYIDPEKCANAREKYRSDYIKMLGWPLDSYDSLKNTPMQVKKVCRGEVEWATVWSMEFEVLPTLWFYGLYFESKNRSENTPFIIAQHGGSGNPEVASELWGDNNYNGMVRRAAEMCRDADIFAPQLYLWTTDEERQALDIKLKQAGGSITALEIYSIRRALDRFCEAGVAREGHIGMIGLSYGGFYSLMTAAADTRICASYSSCQFSDRYKYGRTDWIWDGSAERFLDAEIAGLVAPRALFLDEADHDEFFESEYFVRECERAIPFFAACGAEEKIKYQVFSGVHEFCPNDNGIKFISENI